MWQLAGIALFLIAQPQSPPPTSKPPIPTPAKPSNEPQAQAKSEPKPPDPENGRPSPWPTPIDTKNRPADRTDDPQEQRTKQDEKSSLEWWGDLAMVVSTVVMAVFTGLLWWIARAQTNMVHGIERAYMSISHIKPGLRPMGPGTEIVPSSPINLRPNIPIDAHMVVINEGNTPSTVIEYGMELRVGNSLAPSPTYASEYVRREEFFLPPKTRLLFWLHEVGLFKLSLEDHADVIVEKKQIWLVGYVIYEDVFKKRHVTGYARRYKPIHPEEHNLIVDTSTNGYNYDRDI